MTGGARAAVRAVGIPATILGPSSRGSGSPALRPARPGDREPGATPPGARSDDWAHVVLAYPGLRVVLQAGMLVAGGSPRFVVHGESGSLIKHRGGQLRGGAAAGRAGPGGAGMGRGPGRAGDPRRGRGGDAGAGRGRGSAAVLPAGWSETIARGSGRRCGGAGGRPGDGVPRSGLHVGPHRDVGRPPARAGRAGSLRRIVPVGVRALTLPTAPRNPGRGRRTGSGGPPGLQNQWYANSVRWVRFPSASAKPPSVPDAQGMPVSRRPGSARESTARLPQAAALFSIRKRRLPE